MTREERRAHSRHDVSTRAELKLEQGGASEDDQTRRSHARVAVAFEIEIEAPLKLSGQEVMRLELVGTTIDISRGGMLVRVDRDVIPGAWCEVRFPDAKGQIEPDRTQGQVRRSKANDDSSFELAIEFDEPLETVKKTHTAAPAAGG